MKNLDRLNVYTKLLFTKLTDQEISIPQLGHLVYRWSLFVDVNALKVQELQIKYEHFRQFINTLSQNVGVRMLDRKYLYWFAHF